MGLFNKYNKSEDQILKEVTQGFVMSGASSSEAKRMATEMLDEAIAEAKTAGYYNEPPGGGERLLAAAENNPALKARVARLKNEGVRDDDIRWWWNMTEVGRRMFIKPNDLTRLGVFIQGQQELGLNGEQAAARVRKIFPMYGDPDDTSATTGDDRPLPSELRRRVMDFTSRSSPTQLKVGSEQFSTFNAYVRSLLRAGTL